MASSASPASSPFLSTLPVRGATVVVVFKLVHLVISIHAPREGSDERGHLPVRRHRISIHAPREGSDALTSKQKAFVQISIHAPREGSDQRTRLPARVSRNFYPRSP